MRAVMGRVDKAWRSFKVLGGLLCGRNLGLKPKLREESVRSFLGQEVENLSVDVKGLNKLVQTERNMLTMIFAVTPRDRITS